MKVWTREVTKHLLGAGLGPLSKILAVKICKGAFTYDVRCFWGIFDLPTYPNQILYYMYISLFSEIR